MATSGPKPKPIEERFWPKVRKTPTCWLWTGAKLPKGYGVIGRGGRRGGYVYAHRLAYSLFVRPLVPGEHVHHECGVPSCVNPAHLQALTVDTHNRADLGKLSDDAVAVIRSSPETNATLARTFGVDPSIISRVRRGLSWR